MISFVTSFSITLSGPVNDKYNMYAVPRSISYSYIKKTQIEYLQKDAPSNLLLELNSAREMCRGEENEDVYVTFIKDVRDNDPDYTILYRKTMNIPTVYTIEAIVAGKNPKISLANVEDILNKFCKDNRGYLQTYPLKIWSKRLFNTISLEKSFRKYVKFHIL